MFSIFLKLTMVLSILIVCSSILSRTSINSFLVLTNELLNSFIISDITLETSLVSAANDLISTAITEKPLPYSPALEASIDAFIANKLVCCEILFILLI